MSIRALVDEFRIGLTTASNIIDEVCHAIISSMSLQYLPNLLQQDWIQSEVGFRNIGFPHAIGAIDGKHFCCKVSSFLILHHKSFEFLATFWNGICILQL